MFIILLTYKKPIAEIEQHLAEHRAYLDQCYQQDYFLASGPQNPRVGGAILSGLKDRQQLENILSADPFCLKQLADYTIIEFNPIKYHQKFASALI